MRNLKRLPVFLEALPAEKLLNENEEALLLVGGAGNVPTTNNGCSNDSCSGDRIDNGCTNNGCNNRGC